MSCLTTIQTLRPLAVHLTGRRAEAFTDALDKFERGVKAGQIYNAEYQDAYSYGLVRGLEAIYDSLKMKYLQTHRDDPDFSEMYWTSFGVPSIKKMVRIASRPAFASKVPELAAFVQSISGVPHMIDDLKKIIVKGRKPVEPKAGEFVKPVVPFNAHRMAYDFLAQAVAQIKNEYYDSFEKSVVAEIEELDRRKLVPGMKTNERDSALAVRFFDNVINRRRDDKSPIVLKSNWKALAAADARKTVDEIIEAFISKNSSKLGHIFAKKTNVVDHKIVSIRVQGKNLENTMYFSFPDGSSFTIYSSTVYGSRFGYKGYTNYVQYPTRFTDVRLADGTKMKMPSEEKMITMF